MVARAVRTNTNARGARPFDPTRDLTAVARLLEEAFRSEHTFPLSDTPILREAGILLWTLSYAPVFPENITGFVWLEEGQIVGNVTISQDEGRLDRYLISNVAVKPDYRRRGIARSLMQIAIEHLESRSAKWALLNVRPQNEGAVKLYRNLGFTEIEMRGEWSASPLREADLPEPTLTGVIRPMRSHDRYAVGELLRVTTPPDVLQFRTPRLAEYGPNWEDRITETLADFLIGQATRRWVLQKDRDMMALIMLRAQRLASPHRLAIQTHPTYRGHVEDQLVHLALCQLSSFPKREIRAAGTSTHPELIASLERHGFRFLNGLTLMALSFRGSIR